MDHLLKTKKKYKNSKELEIQDIDKACFQHDMAYGDFKDLPKRIASDKILRDKAFDTAKNSKNDGCQRGLASMIYTCFVKRTSGGAIKSEIMSNQELGKELYKPIISNFKKRKVDSFFIGNIRGADLADIQLISKFNKGICFLFMCYRYL